MRPISPPCRGIVSIEHDKVMLIGSSDSATADLGKLRVTVHHNVFNSNVQRTPRVRFGQVHVYNNYYVVKSETYGYSWGVGVQSQIYAENNYFVTDGTVDPSRFISRFNGTLIFIGDTLLNGRSQRSHVDVLAVYNAARDPGSLECRDVDTAPGWRVPPDTGGSRRGQKYGRDVPRSNRRVAGQPPSRRLRSTSIPGTTSAKTGQTMASSEHRREGAEQTEQERYANGELALAFLSSG